MPPIVKKQAEQPLQPEGQPSNGKAIKPSKPAKAQKAEEREVGYPELACNVYAEGGDLPPMTAEVAEILLGWETEEQYAAKRIAANPKLKPEQLRFSPSEVLLTDHKGNKVRALHNAGNRLFDRNITDSYVQDILNRVWAPDGPNGETIIISRYKDVLSGQKRLAALILARQLWERDKHHWIAKWPTEPTIETFVAFGVNPTERTLRTIDNVQTRTEADTYYTSPQLAENRLLWVDPKNRSKGVDQAKRKEYARSLSFAVDALWKRTAQAQVNRWEKSQTHSASHAFLDRHGRLRECVNHLFALNNGLIEGIGSRAVNELKLYAGEVAALMYLMASSGTKEDSGYATADPPSEDKLDFGEWDRAAAFCADLAKPSSPLRKLLAKVRKPVEGQLVSDPWQGWVFAAKGPGGTKEERLGVLAKAWAKYEESGSVKATEQGLRLEYHSPDKQDEQWADVVLDCCPTVGGIDRGQKPKKVEAEDEAVGQEEAAPTPSKRSQEIVEKLKADREKKAKGLAGMLEDAHAAFPDKLLLFKAKEDYRAYGPDATDAATVLRLSTMSHGGILVCTLSAAKIEQHLSKLVSADKRVAVIEQGPDGGFIEVKVTENGSE